MGVFERIATVYLEHSTLQAFRTAVSPLTMPGQETGSMKNISILLYWYIGNPWLMTVQSYSTAEWRDLQVIALAVPLLSDDYYLGDGQPFCTYNQLSSTPWSHVCHSQLSLLASLGSHWESQQGESQVTEVNLLYLCTLWGPSQLLLLPYTP